MKILYICTLWDEEGTGGREVHARNLASHFSRDNEVVVVNTHRSVRTRIFRKDNIKFYKIFHWNVIFYEDYCLRSAKIGFFIKALWHFIDTFNFLTAFQVILIIKKEKPDVIHIQDIKGLSTILCLLLKLYRLKVVFSLHSHEFLCIAGVFLCPLSKGRACRKDFLVCKLYRFLKRSMVSNSVHTVIAPSKFTLEMHKRYGFFKYAITEIIPNGINIKPIQLKINKDKSSFNILYIGRLCKDKGVDVLITAFKELQNGSLSLHIVGVGPEMASLRNLAKNDKRIIFHGRAEHKEIDKFYRISDFIVLPSICYENCPMVILESFSFGVPVIGSSIGGVKELIIDNITGLTFELGNSQDLRQKMQYFINNPKAMEDCGNSARDFIVKNFSLNNNYNSLNIIYEKCIIFHKH